MAQELQPFLLHLSYFLFQSCPPLPTLSITWSLCSLLSAAYPPPSPLLGKIPSGLPHSSIFILLLQDTMHHVPGLAKTPFTPQEFTWVFLFTIGFLRLLPLLSQQSSHQNEPPSSPSIRSSVLFASLSAFSPQFLSLTLPSLQIEN